MKSSLTHHGYVYTPKVVFNFHVLDQQFHCFGDWWSAFLSVLQFVICPVVFNGFLPSVQNGFRRHQGEISSCLWIADKHGSDEPFLLDGEGEFDILLLEVPFVFLILLPDQCNLRDY